MRGENCVIEAPSPRDNPRPPDTSTTYRRMYRALVYLLLVALTGCGLGSGASHGRQGGGAPAYSSAYPVSFASSVTYEQALREV